MLQPEMQKESLVRLVGIVKKLYKKGNQYWSRQSQVTRVMLMPINLQKGTKNFEREMNTPSQFKLSIFASHLSRSSHTQTLSKLSSTGESKVVLQTTWNNQWWSKISFKSNRWSHQLTRTYLHQDKEASKASRLDLSNPSNRILCSYMRRMEREELQPL